MSFFRRKESPQVPPPRDDPPPRNDDPYGYGANDRYGAAPDRYGGAPDRYGGAPDRYGSAPAPDRYGGQQSDRYGASPAPDRYGSQAPAPRAPNKLTRAPPPRGGSGDAPPPVEPDRYRAAQRTVGDPYARGGDAAADRSALFAGRDPDAPRRYFDDGPGRGPGGGGMPTEEELDRRRADNNDEEEDIEAIRGAIKTTKQESLASTRNALRIAREAEETARSTLVRLGDQSEKIADAERHIDVAKWNSVRAADKTDELKQLNKSIFRPVITFNKDAKRAAQEAKMLARHEEERDERERTQAEVRDSQGRIGRATAYGGRDDYGDDAEALNAPSRGGRYRSEAELSARKATRKRFQFEATASDDELEDELDDNLDAIGDAVGKMKGLSLAMGQEVERQNERLRKFEDKTDDVDRKIVRNTNRLKNIK